MPCVQKRKAAEYEKFIHQNRRTLDLYKGVTDPVETIHILLTSQRPDPLVQFVPPPKSLEEFCGALNSSEADQLMLRAEQEFKSGNIEVAEGMAQSLATFTDFALDPLLESWIEGDHLWPSVIFRNAGSAVRDRLLAKLSRASAASNLNHTLRALAWIGDHRVCDAFLGLEKSPPAWLRHVDPSRYAHVAGWEPTQDGRRDLYHKKCLAIHPVAAGETACQSVSLLKEAHETCPWCRSPLVNFFEFKLSTPEVSFLGLSGPNLPVLTCEACSCFGPVFGNIDRIGVAHWSSMNRRPDWLPNDIALWDRGPWSGKAVRLTPRRAVHAVEWCSTATTSQVGGLPSWVQNAEYPGCPDCQKTMTFIAQLDNGHFPGNEGIYYAFLCGACRVTATTYQQS
ncbi:MAG TPA: hypothetical protein PLX89_18135 [Verrucomicrobiota bacterium]|nr:hypothetical protein [Verrucomicrobiales bacterium]HRI14920.1 hypothetical protein [Verrucomicrobiota bacterium]